MHFYNNQKQSDASGQSWRRPANHPGQKLLRRENGHLDGGVESGRHTVGKFGARNPTRAGINVIKLFSIVNHEENKLRVFLLVKFFRASLAFASMIETF